MTPAGRLLAAADLLDKRAGEATGGPWNAEDPYGGRKMVDVVAYGKPTAAGWEQVAFEVPAGNGAYIATMHPEVGKALAKVFRMWAKIVLLDEDLIHRIGGDETLAVADLLLAGAS